MNGKNNIWDPLKQISQNLNHLAGKHNFKDYSSNQIPISNSQTEKFGN